MTAKKPKDYRSKRAPFQFVVDGDTYTLRSPSFGTMADLLDSMGDPKGMLSLVGACTDDEAMTAIRSLDAQDANELFSDWMESMGGSGNSEGSSTS